MVRNKREGGHGGIVRMETKQPSSAALGTSLLMTTSDILFLLDICLKKPAHDSLDMGPLRQMHTVDIQQIVFV